MEVLTDKTLADAMTYCLKVYRAEVAVLFFERQRYVDFITTMHQLAVQRKIKGVSSPRMQDDMRCIKFINGSGIFAVDLSDSNKYFYGESDFNRIERAYETIYSRILFDTVMPKAEEVESKELDEFLNGFVVRKSEA